MSTRIIPSISECGCSGPITRRDFIKTAIGGTAAAAAIGSAPGLLAAKKDQPETLVTTLYKSLTEEQRKAVVFPFDHPLRSKVDNNWHITKPTLGDFYTPDQQAMVR